MNAIVGVLGLGTTVILIGLVVVAILARLKNSLGVKAGNVIAHLLVEVADLILPGSATYSNPSVKPVEIAAAPSAPSAPPAKP